MKKLAGLVMLVLFASMFGVAANAMEIHDLSVKPFDALTPAPDTILITGIEDWTWVNPDGVAVKDFYLPHGTYDVTVQKSGYVDFVHKNAVIDDNSNPVVNVYYQLTPVEGQDDDSSDADDNADDSDNGQVEPNMRIKLDIKDDEIKPGDKLELEVELDNKLGYKAEDVVVTVTVFDIDDDDDDLDDEVEFKYISDDREKTKDFTFVIPYDADEGNYDIEVEVTWEDTAGDDQRNTAEDTFEVEKVKHDVAVINTYLGSETIAPGKTTEIAVEVANIGKNDENVRIKIESADLNVEEWSALFELEEGDVSTQYIPFKVPSNVEAGKYFVNAIVYFDSGSNSDADFVTLTVGDDSTGVTGAVSLTPVVTTVATEGAGNFGASGDAYTIGALIVGILILLAVIVIVGKEVLPRRATIIESTKRRR